MMHLFGLLAVLLLFAPTSPTIRGHVAAPGRPPMFVVSYDPGAVWTCLVYQEQVVRERTPNWPDGHYTPRHCFGLDAASTSYQQPFNRYIIPTGGAWNVWVEVGFINNERTPDGSDVTYLTTNVVTVRR